MHTLAWTKTRRREVPTTERSGERGGASRSATLASVCKCARGLAPTPVALRIREIKGDTRAAARRSAPEDPAEPAEDARAAEPRRPDTEFVNDGTRY